MFNLNPWLFFFSIIKWEHIEWQTKRSWTFLVLQQRKIGITAHVTTECDSHVKINNCQCKWYATNCSFSCGLPTTRFHAKCWHLSWQFGFVTLNFIKDGTKLHIKTVLIYSSWCPMDFKFGIFINTWDDMWLLGLNLLVFFSFSTQ